MELTESYFLGRAVSEQSDMVFFLSYGFSTWQLINCLVFLFSPILLIKNAGTYFSPLVSSESFL